MTDKEKIISDKEFLVSLFFPENVDSDEIIHIKRETLIDFTGVALRYSRAIQNCTKAQRQDPEFKKCLAVYCV
jgi:hypothetical protein